MNKKKYQELLEDWFAYTFLEAVETLPKVLNNPQEAQREMNRLKRHCEFNLGEAVELLEVEA